MNSDQMLSSNANVRPIFSAAMKSETIGPPHMLINNSLVWANWQGVHRDTSPRGSESRHTTLNRNGHLVTESIHLASISFDSTKRAHANLMNPLFSFWQGKFVGE
ncbi:hypothetical protein Syun_028759 [Stephania yunnanensis]|uniref:Uncharacterized protein n=1 Tax=Stephania yunnanensis TaxID=152371 RepID=A0AAP0E455_9MAGN